MKMFVCSICGHIEFENIPENCPVCHAPKTDFLEDPSAIKQPADPNNLSESEKKHIPVLQKMDGSDGVRVSIKVGEILHVMEEKHYITWIDLYWNNQYISRYSMTPNALHPVVETTLKESGGTLTAIESCNIHGRWMNMLDI